MKELGIVVPVFNNELYLSECIESICSQDFTGWQLFLVDDGSTDSSGKICDEYANKDKRIAAIHQRNRGPILARYTGVLNANTKYITFVDSDDWIDRDTYSEASRYMKDGIDVIEYQMKRCHVADGYTTYDTHYDADYVYRNNDLEEIIRRTMVWNCRKIDEHMDPSLCNKLIKRELLLEEYENAKNLSFHYGEDMAIVYPILQRCESYVFSSGGGYNHRRYKKDEDFTYFRDEHFFEKLTKLYAYLKKRLKTKVYEEQLDFFFSYAVKKYMGRYKEQGPDLQYLFPFHRVPQGSRIVLYGAGTVGKAYYSELNMIPYCQVVLWVDKRANIENVASVNSIVTVDYDYVVIAIHNQYVIKSVKGDLISLGVSEDKIVWNDSEG